MTHSSDRTGLAEAVSDAIAAISVLAYPPLHARVAQELEPARVELHAADCARRLLRGIQLLRAGHDAPALDWIVDAEPVAEALVEELGDGTRALSPPAAGVVRLARELLRHLLIASGFADGAGGWDRDRDTVPPLEAWQSPSGAPGK